MSKKLKICVYAICRDESQFVDRFMDSVKDADGVYVLDTGSVDDTIEKLRARGAVVVRRVYDKWKTLEEYDALVAARKNPWRFDRPRNISLGMVPDDTDIVVCIDIDEVMQPGWRQYLEKNWKADTTSLRYMYAWSPERTFSYNKITARLGYEWRTPIHETIYPIEPAKEKIVWTNELLVVHMPDASKSRAQYLPLLELAVRESPACVRSSYYLGREYTYAHKWPEAIKELKRYLSLGGYPMEREEACLMIANAESKLKNKEQQEHWLLRACAEDPKQREPWVELADFYRLKGTHILGYAAAKHALSMNHTPASHLNRPDCWGARPFDVASVCAFYAGHKQESYDLAFEALQRDPYDERLIKNCHVVQDIKCQGEKEEKTGWPIVNVIILSYAKTPKEWDMTARCITSLVQSSPTIGLCISVVETNSDAKKYPEWSDGKRVSINTFFPCESFNYNKFLQIGRGTRRTDAKYCLILNNDVTAFNQNFLETMIDGLERQSVDSVSPIGLREQSYRKQNLNIEAYLGFDVNREVNGWCMLFSEDILKTVTFEKLFPADLKFYYQDNWYAQMLKNHGFKHAVLTAPRALHLQRQSHGLVSEEKRKELTDEQRKVFEELLKRETPLS